MKITLPKNNINTEKCLSLSKEIKQSIENDEAIIALRIEDIEEPNLEINRIDFKQIFFEKALLIDSKIKNSYFLDVSFINCDLSNVHFNDCLFNRVHFKNCKLLGTSFVDCTFQHTLIHHSNVQYSNFSNCKFKSLKFEDSIFIESYLYDNFITFFEVNNCDLSKVECFNTSFYNIDLSTDTLDGIRIQPKDIKGAIVSYHQAAELAQLLGLVIKG